MFSHEEELLRRFADEIWWLHDGRLAGRGDPEEMLAAYRRHVAARVRAWGGRDRRLRSRHDCGGATAGPRFCESRPSAKTASPPWSGAAANWRWPR